MTRIDTHRPSAIEPSEYAFVSFHSHRADDVWESISEQQAFRSHMISTGAKFSTHSHGGSCHVCGAHAYTVARFHHAPTNTYVEVGEICAEKLHSGEALNFRSFRAKAKAGMEAAAGKAKAVRFLKDAGVTCAYDIWLQKDYDNWEWEEATIFDIVSKLVRYGSISDKQVAFISKLMKKIDDRAEIAAQRAAEAEAAAPIPCDGERIHVRGEVITTKYVETNFGEILKMLVRHADGWKVWGSVPASIDPLRGDIVTFDAKVNVSKDDEKFGFFSRPTKAKILGA